MRMDEQIFSIKEAIFWVAGVLGVLTLKFLSWFMPQTAALWIEKLRKMLTNDLVQNVNSLTSKVDILIIENSKYKSEKHRIEGELVECRDAIVNDDAEKLQALKEVYTKIEKENLQKIKNL
jgi:hypothetical protein